jgi:hypothetical protein
MPVVTAKWDAEAKVWVATSDDIAGLVTEAPTLDALVERLTAVASELLDDDVQHVGGSLLSEVIDLHVLAPYR